MQGVNLSKGQDDIGITEFCVQIKRRIQQRLGTKFYVVVQEIVKNNDVKLHELIITESGYNRSLSICLTCYYRKYQKEKNLDIIERNIIDAYKRIGC